MHPAPGARPDSPTRAARPRPSDLLARPPRRAVRTGIGVAGLALTVTAMLVVQSPPTASATDVFGALRAPGEPAFTVGHRGDRAHAPENTLPSLELAMDGLEFVETDVQLTRDGVPVLFHDVELGRVTGDPHRVDELTFEQLARLDAGRRYDPAFAGTRIPTLDAFLAAFAERDGARALIELKAAWTPDEVRIVTDLLERRGVDGRVVLQSFSIETLDSIAEVAPNLPRIMLIRELPDDPRPLARRFGVIGFGTTAESVSAEPEALELAHQAGIAVLCYTLNSEQRWSEVAALGVDGIITDRPSELDAWLAATAPGT